MCPNCRTENPPGMKFCRHCGTVLQASAPGLPPQPMGYGQPQGYGQPAYPPPGGGYGQPMPPPGPMGVAPTMAAPMGPPGAGIAGGGVVAGSAAVAGSIGNPPSAPQAMPSACPRCGSPVQPGFMFCQQCGTKLTPTGGGGVDAHAGTLAASGPVAAAIRAGGPAAAAPTPMSPMAPAPMSPMAPPPMAPAPRTPTPVPPPSAQAVGLAPTPAAGGWGTAISVNRDGTDGDRYPLTGEFVVIGRVASSGADIVFEQDRFLARQHARLEATPDGAARVVPLDQLNGVYRKIDAPVPLSDGMIVLAGREVLRYETVDADERTGTPLIRHGVALFGSPPREPWARLLQLLPSGGVRDIRHLWDDEIVIGREDGDLVFADDQFLSRRHCSIAWDGSRALLADLGSSDGTFLRLAGPTPVKHGDHLRMGDQLFRIELRR